MRAQHLLGGLDGRQQRVLRGVGQRLQRGGVDHGGHAHLDRPGRGLDARHDHLREPRVGHDVGRDDLGALVQVEEPPERLVDADLEVLGRQRQGVVRHQAQRLQRHVELDLRLLEAAPRRGRVLDQAAEVDLGERPALVSHPLDQVEPPPQAAGLPLGAAARLEVAVLLARDEQGPGRGGPVGEQLRLLGRRGRRALGGGAGPGHLRRGLGLRGAPDVAHQGRDQAQGGQRPARGSGHRHPSPGSGRVGAHAGRRRRPHGLGPSCARSGAVIASPRPSGKANRCRHGRCRHGRWRMTDAGWPEVPDPPSGIR